MSGFNPISGVLYRVNDSHTLHRTFNVQPIYLRHENTGATTTKTIIIIIIIIIIISIIIKSIV